MNLMHYYFGAAKQKNWIQISEYLIKRKHIIVSELMTDLEETTTILNDSLILMGQFPEMVSKQPCGGHRMESVSQSLVCWL